MAASGSGPRWTLPDSLPGSRSASRPETPSIPRHCDNERQCFSATFPSGQRTHESFSRASSYLLRELIQRYRRLDAEEEEDHFVVREEEVKKELVEAEYEEESSDSDMQNQEGCDLADISILSEYIHLQKLDLSINKIEDLSCVSCMPYLLELNASQNRLTTFFNFNPPRNLKKVDFSYNQISEMTDLSAYQALTKLILDNNQIQEIKGLELCCNLTHLSLARNKITTIDGLSMLPIKNLCLSNNQIEKITGLEELKVLQKLDLSNNQISSLQGLENHDLLEVLNLEENKIEELREIEYIEKLPLLRILNLLRNPIQVSAVNMYDPPPEVLAAQDHLTHIVNSMMQPQRIFDSTLPSLDAPYPMLILAGPQACGKRELAHRLCRQFSTYFRYGACHTTRPPYFGEGDRVDYHFVSQEVFDEMLNMGKFILTFNYCNHNYGLNRDTVEGIARDGLASCIHMEIEGVRSLKCTYFEPRYILVVPMNKTKYEGHLRRKGLFSRAEIELAVSRVDLYIKVNQTFPGYFDAIINADDMEVAYQRLSQLVKEYLGLTEEPTKGLAPTTGAPSSKMTLSGVPAHLVPSPRRLAKLQADGQMTEHLSGSPPKAPESQTLAQNQESTTEGETLKEEALPSSQADPEPPPQHPSESGLGAPHLARDSTPDQKEEDTPQPAPSPKGNEVPPSQVKTSEPGPSPTSLPQVPAQSNQDEESGEATVAPSSPPPPPNDSQKPPNGKSAKANAVRVSTPYPELPHAQGSSTDTKQTQDRDEPGALRPKGQLAPTRLPQPRTLAPLQSPRPTPKLLSPSREGGTGSDQTRTPSPRHASAQEGDSGKLPPISPSQPKHPPNRSPNSAPNPQAVQEEVRLPPISPASQESASQHSPQAPQDPEAQKVKLPPLSNPSEPAPLQAQGAAQRFTTPTREKKNTPRRKIPDKLASPQSQESTGARKKKLPIPRETPKGSDHLRKAAPGGRRLESHRKYTTTKVPVRQDPSPPRSPAESTSGEVQEGQSAPELPLGEPLSGEAQEQSEPAPQPGSKAQLKRKEPLHKRGRPLKRGQASEPPEPQGEAPGPLPATETQAPKGTDLTREGSVHRDKAAASQQLARERRTQKRDPSLAAAQSQLPNESQDIRRGRLRARGSQSTKM
ncbi:leucine-rich repeat and guanylate kinase domain-containing protein [Echinops telfairi]|uniref:Leucine-rich repeat and guanylate kinase domain-containing protein n=1 Tax=Echinops telfairi TaxID=9371 RepID=A0AC55CZD7_ECHTE|nr:leucine-rich repeat and guanylate kinase domain-containing protein [Echinops telfairi]